MNKDNFDIYNFLKDIKEEIAEEVKENSYKTSEEIDNCIINIVDCYLTYYDYIRDVTIIYEFETKIFEYNICKLEQNEGIASFLNRLAKDVLTQYLINEYDINEVEK
ncbi:MAG: hypothetical protein PHF30_05105 [Bacilli bacterium]|nr:hypothetical protein [Bacilli bacterium]